MICFAWMGFPQYAARCVRATVEATGEKIVVVADRPVVPISGMEEACGCELHWIDNSCSKSLRQILGGELPRVLIISGWSHALFNRFRDEVVAEGGRIVAMSDNNSKLGGLSMFGFRWWKGLLVETAKALLFRMFIRSRYDAFFVPGASGVKLLRFYGVSKKKIHTGLYAADPTLFFSDRAIAARARRIIYVGQLIERKNVMRMISAFGAAIKKSKADFSLELYGSGPLKGALKARAEEINREILKFKSQIVIKDFVQPEQLAPLYRDSWAVCLPSLEEHWGLVVHEAALSGCLLLLSQTVGAAADLLVDGCGEKRFVNGVRFNPYKEKEIIKAFEWLFKKTDQVAHDEQAKSIAKAKTIGTEGFASTVLSFVHE